MNVARAWYEFDVIPVKAKVLAASMMSGSDAILVWLADTWILPIAVGGVLAMIASWLRNVTRPSCVPYN
jgi:uncharacterized membrane protein YbaN (DUF454 family)